MLYCFGVPRKIEFAFAFVYFLTLSQDESRGKIFIPVGSKSGLWASRLSTPRFTLIAYFCVVLSKQCETQFSGKFKKVLYKVFITACLFYILSYSENNFSHDEFLISVAIYKIRVVNLGKK